MGSQAFDGPRGQHFYADPYRVAVIGLAGREGSGPLDTAHGKDEHELWDERVLLPVDHAMVANIRTRGVLEAVKVRKNGKYTSGKHAGEDIIEVVDGRSRTRACRLAQQKAEAAGETPPLLKIEFVKSGDVGFCLGVMVSANEHRREDQPHVKAEKAARILALGHPVEDVANMFGVTDSCVRQWRKFAGLEPAVRKAVGAGKLTFSAAVKLHGLSGEAQRGQLAELIAAGEAGEAPTAAAAGRAAVRGGKRPPQTRTVLSRGKLRKFAEDEDFMSGLSRDARALVRVLLGNADSVTQVPGLSKLLKV